MITGRALLYPAMLARVSGVNHSGAQDAPASLRPTLAEIAGDPATERFATD
ncbi:hypothetical protein ACFYPZ_14360 [Streptomyces sp. NPDC005506]|uniref:hypothetical protein n=1 Tax=unclassified Streptomyces TaxID=2593676 RepID=UPI00367BFD02